MNYSHFTVSHLINSSFSWSAANQTAESLDFVKQRWLINWLDPGASEGKPTYLCLIVSQGIGIVSPTQRSYSDFACRVQSSACLSAAMETYLRAAPVHLQRGAARTHAVCATTCLHGAKQLVHVKDTDLSSLLGLLHQAERLTWILSCKK